MRPAAVSSPDRGGGLGQTGAIQRRQRRAVLRAHHPDLGGDAAELIAALRRLELDRSASTDRFDGEVVFIRRPRGLARVTAWWKSRRTPPTRSVL